MKTIESNQYLVKQLSNQEWHFFHLPNAGICFRKRINSVRQEYEILFKDGLGDFNVAVDKNDRIHLVCQDKLGNINYFMYNGRYWQKYLLLQSRSNKVYSKYFKILYVNGWINLFYIIEHKNRYLLTHQILDHDAKPVVLDYVADSIRPYAAAVDNLHNIHVYYESDTDSRELGYKTYLWSKKAWSNFTPVDKDTGNLIHPYIIIDDLNMLHLIYQKKFNSYYEIIYRQKTLNNNNASWSSEIVIDAPNREKDLPVIIKADKKLWILWQDDYRVMSSFSEDNGISWKGPIQFMTGRAGNIELFGCRLPPSNDAADIICDQCYGYILNNHLNIYVLSNYIDQLVFDDSNNKPEYKTEGFEVEEFARQYMHEFKEKSSENQGYEHERVDAVNNKENIEYQKLKIMFNMLQEDLNQIKKKTDEFSIAARPDKELGEKYNAEIENLKKELRQITEKVASLEEKQNKIIETEIKKLHKEISILKRNSNKISFEDLISKK